MKYLVAILLLILACLCALLVLTFYDQESSATACEEGGGIAIRNFFAEYVECIK